VVAATTLGRAVARLGYGRLLLAGYAVGALAVAGIPFVSGSAGMQAILYALLFFTAGCGIIALNIATMTLRQVATPASAQGRVTVAYGFLIGALIPVSAILAGVLGERLGLRATLFVAAAGVPVSMLWLIFSPVRKLRTLDDLSSNNRTCPSKGSLHRPPSTAATTPPRSRLARRASEDDPLRRVGGQSAGGRPPARR
jgi:MFS family permease